MIGDPSALRSSPRFRGRAPSPSAPGAARAASRGASRWPGNLRAPALKPRPGSARRRPKPSYWRGRAFLRARQTPPTASGRRHVGHWPPSTCGARIPLARGLTSDTPPEPSHIPAATPASTSRACTYGRRYVVTCRPARLHRHLEAVAEAAPGRACGGAPHPPSDDLRGPAAAPSSPPGTRRVAVVTHSGASSNLPRAGTTASGSATRPMCAPGCVREARDGMTPADRPHAGPVKLASADHGGRRRRLARLGCFTCRVGRRGPIADDPWNNATTRRI